MDENYGNPNQLRKDGKYAEAIQLYEQLPDKSENDVTGLAYCYRKTKEYEKAARLCYQAIQNGASSEWLIGHTVYGMSSIIHSTSLSPELVMHIFLNAIAITSISAAFGLFFFRRYEL